MKDGLCEYCQDFDNNRSRYAAPRHSIADLTKLINHHVSARKYDATLLLSGGKDSAYILHRIRHEYPDLKVLCLVVDNGFMSKWAIPNARHITEKLNVDLLIVTSYIDEFKRNFRDAFLKLNGRGTYGLVDFADGELIFKIGEEITRYLTTGLMISGLSWVQLERILNISDFYRDADGVTHLYPLAVWCVDEQDIRRYVRDNDLVLKGSDSPIVSNNRLIPLMSALDVLNLGYSSFEPEFAQLIREGKSSRSAWLHVFEFLNYAVMHGFLNREVKNILAELDLDIEHVLRGV